MSGIYFKIEVQHRPGNHQLDKNVQEMGLCCPLAFFRMNLRDSDTIKSLAKKAKVCKSTIKNHRKALKEGRLKCFKRDSCLRALWMTPGQMFKVDKDFEKAKAFQASPPTPVADSSST